MVGLFLIGSVLELFGIASLLPLLGNLLGADTELSGPIGDVMRRIGLSRLPSDSLLLLLVGLMVFKSLFLMVGMYVTGTIGVRIGRELTDNLTRTIYAAGWPFQLEQSSGRLVNTIVRETEQGSSAVGTLGQLISQAIVLVVLMMVLLLVSVPAFGLSIVFGVLVFVLVARIQVLSRRLAEKRIALNHILYSVVMENLHLAKFLKASALEDLRSRYTETFTREVQRLRLREVKYAAIIQHYGDAFGVCLVVGICFVNLEFGLTSPENLLLFLILTYRTYTRIAAFQVLRRRLNTQLPAYTSAYGLLVEAGENVESYGGDRQVALNAGIELKNISFTFPNGAKVLDKLSLTIPSYEMVALVGPSGAGKTTITDLLLGLVRPQIGDVLVDNNPLDTYNLAGWRQQLGYVPQDPVLFNGSIRDNIAVGKTDAAEEEVKAAAKAAHAHQFISEQPNGYQAVIGDRGLKLSGGQRQRIAFARALIGKPRLLILDEATSALDNESEREVQRTINDLKGTVTILVVAHRLSTVERCDRIHVVEDGRVVESGSFEELSRASGRFQELYELHG